MLLASLILGVPLVWLENLLARWRIDDNQQLNGSPDSAPSISGDRRNQGQKTSIVNVKEDTPQFKGVAAGGYDHQTVTSFEPLQVNLGQAFPFSRPVVDHRLLAGRKEILVSLIRTIEDIGGHTMLYGARGVGKTSILHVLAQFARDAGYLVVYETCGARSDFNEVFRSIAAKIPLLYKQGLSPSSSDIELGKTFADFLPNGLVSPQIASETLAGVVGTRIIVILDEFDQRQTKRFGIDILDFLKGLSDRSARVHLVVAGVAANFFELVDNSRRLHRDIVPLQLRCMTPSEIDEQVRIGAAISRLDFDAAAIDCVVASAKGLPFIASLLCYCAGSKAQRSHRSTVGRDDILSAIRETIEQFGARLSCEARANIAHVAITGDWEALGELVNVAHLLGGRFDLDDLRSLCSSSAAAARCVRLAEQLAADGELIIFATGVASSGFYFLEEAAMHYLGLKFALSNLERSYDSESVKSASDDKGA